MSYINKENLKIIEHLYAYDFSLLPISLFGGGLKGYHPQLSITTMIILIYLPNRTFSCNQKNVLELDSLEISCFLFDVAETKGD